MTQVEHDLVFHLCKFDDFLLSRTAQKAREVLMYTLKGFNFYSEVEAGKSLTWEESARALPGAYKNLYNCYLQGSEVSLCIVRNQLTLHLAMYESFTALQLTIAQVFVANLYGYIHICFWDTMDTWKAFQMYH